ncbi:MAG: hypothetical protein EOM41_06755 [Bacilli bacterium]|nr:hypothetical protein [Bacilli bacterium]
MDKVEEQLNIRLSDKDLKDVHEAMKKFGSNISQSSFGRMALKYFISQLEAKGALGLLAETMDK